MNSTELMFEYVDLKSDLCPTSTDVLVANCVTISAQGANPYIVMNCCGDATTRGPAITGSHMIRHIGRPVVTHNEGLVGGTAIFVFLAGARRVASPGATFTDVAALLEDADAATELLSALSAAKFAELVRHPEGITAERARALGIVDEIRQLAFPSDARIVRVGVEA